jgi:L-ribulokinase
MPRYAVGIDFGTESGRVVLVDVADGRELASAVHRYANGVIDRQLPESGRRLEPDWALQDPDDYLAVLQNAVPAVLRESRVDPAHVIGVGIDFTSCTMLPVTSDGAPLCTLETYRSDPHAWVKLWKHHEASRGCNITAAPFRLNGFLVRRYKSCMKPPIYTTRRTG